MTFSQVRIFVCSSSVPPPRSDRVEYSRISARLSSILNVADSLPSFLAVRMNSILSLAWAMVVVASLSWARLFAVLLRITFAEHSSSFTHMFGSPGQG